MKRGAIYIQFLVFYTKNGMFFNLCAFFKKLKLKRKIPDNHIKTICRLFLILVQYLLTKSERELDYYNQKVDIRVAQRIKT